MMQFRPPNLVRKPHSVVRCSRLGSSTGKPSPAGGPARRGPWKSVDDVEFATRGWVHWHNTARLHGYLGDVPPTELEAAFYAAAGSDQSVADFPSLERL
jgi:transposase InsO family protein